MNEIACRVCGSPSICFFRDSRKFYLCSKCSLIFTWKGIKNDEEKMHYESQHSNEYDWLKLGRLCLEYASKFRDKATIYKILDYGSGAGHLTNSLRLHGYQVDSYEPMYDTNLPIKKDSGYDIIILNEVIEHIEDINDTFKTIYEVSSDGAIILIFTVVTDDLINSPMQFVNNFEAWWYKNDMTHVSFFCSLTFEKLSQSNENYNFELLGVHERGALFRVHKQ